MKRFLIPGLFVPSLLALLSATAHGEATESTNDVFANAEQDACAFIDRLGGVRALDSRTAVLFSSFGKPAYVVKLSVPLPELKYSFRYAYIDQDRDGMLCGRSRDSIALPDEAVSVPARITAMTPLDAASIHTLEEKYGVQLASKRRSTTDPNDMVGG